MREVKFADLEKSDKDAIHDVLFQLDIIELKDDDKVEEFFNFLPKNIKAEGQHWGFCDTVVGDNMYVYFKNNYVK